MTSISVALCTYNGERFLGPQLASLAGQTLLPTEIVAGDDGSTDSTWDQLEAWQAENDFVHLERHDTNLGIAQNFAGMIGAARGDLIFLSDQDDVWELDKTEKISQVFADQPSVGYVFTDAVRINRHGRPLGHSLWQSLAVRFDRREQLLFGQTGGFGQLLRGYLVTGCTMAFRAEYKSLVLPIPPTWMHDAWIATCISAVAKGYPLPEQLVRYRQHENQQIGERPRSLWRQYKRAKQMGIDTFEQRLNAYKTLYDRLQSQTRWPVAVEKLKLLENKIEFLSARCRMRTESMRLPAVARHSLNGNYQRFAEGWKAICQDLLLP